MATELALIVEGHSEYDSYPAIMSKIVNGLYCPISNAKGIGNIIKNTADELLKVIKLFKPKKIIITLDYREALREGLVKNCIELKEHVVTNCNNFVQSQQNGSLTMPEEIVVIIVDKTFETWLCADLDALKTNELINGDLIVETFKNVDSELPNPNGWLSTKIKDNADLKSKAHRKKIAKGLRPEIAKNFSRSFRKFFDEINRLNVA